ncbi:MAG: AAA family ATPase [Cyanobacteriota bacterium]|jgi:predicted kinase
MTSAPLRCHLLIGPPGSGKTTLAQQLAPLLQAETGEPGLVLSTDAIREELFGDPAVQGPWEEIRAVLLQHLNAAVEAGTPIIIDATHARRPWRLLYTQVLQLPRPVEWVGWWLTTPLAQCKAWALRRDRPVPEAVIEEFHASLNKRLNCGSNSSNRPGMWWHYLRREDAFRHSQWISIQSIELPRSYGQRDRRWNERAAPVGAGIPNSPQELIAMQENKPERPEKPERKQSGKVKEVLDLIDSLDIDAGEDQQIALTLVRRLESFHNGVVEEMKDDDDAKHSQIIRWSVDADRLYRARMLLESVDLE